MSKKGGKKMKKVIFTDILTGEKFEFTGLNYECLNPQNYSEDFKKWSENRILTQDVIF